MTTLDSGKNRSTPNASDAALWSTQKSKPAQVDLLLLCRSGSHAGALWAHESDDLDITLLAWAKGKRIEAHTNHEVDVMLIGVKGSGVVTINGQRHELRSGTALLVPKGCERALESTSQQFSYISVHRRRRGLMPTVEGKAIS